VNNVIPSVDEKRSFMVRIDLNPNFVAMQGLPYIESNAPIRQFLDCLGDYVTERRIDFCRSFAFVYVIDLNEGRIEKKLYETWKLLYPNHANAISVVVYPYDGSDRQKVLEQIYAAYFGWANYCRLCTEIADEFDLVEQAKAKDFFMEQNYLVSMDQGCGFSRLCSSFADFLDKIHYFEKPSETYSEYVMDETDDTEDTTTAELTGYLWDDEKQGQTVGIDISYYLSPDKHNELRNLLKRLEPLQGKFVFIFRIPYLEEKARREIYEIMADLINLKELVFEPYNELIYCEAFDDILIKHNISVDESTVELFLERLRLEKRDGRFYGFKTVRKIAEEAVLLKVKHDARCKRNGEAVENNKVHAQEISELAANGRKPEKSGYDELHKLVGMEDIETRIREIVAQVKLARKNEKIDAPSLHMRFTGAPGTGKTTVARIIGRIFKEEGILRKGSFFEYGARDLCGKFVGQTAPKTAQICRDAYGSVLFIDEAYALYAGDNETSQNDYGREAIATLIAEMENHRDDMVVIMAGYTEDMDKLMQANSGLRSRMPYIIEFKSYSREQLAAIFMNYVNRHFTAGEGLEDAVCAYFDSLADSYLESKEFANARFVRNLYERTWSKTALRMGTTGASDYTISVEDFNTAKADKEFSEKLQIAKKIGF